MTPRRWTVDSLAGGLAGATLVVALVLGGGQGTLGDTLAQLLALALLATLAWRRARGTLAPWPRWAWVPVVAVVAVPLLQLLPLPEAWWSALPGRAELAAQMQAAGVDVGTRVTLDPAATERALLWLLPGIALYLAAPTLGPRARSVLVMVLLALAALSVVLGLLQMAAGPQSALRFYRITNAQAAVGLFANSNHLASLLVLCLPLAIAGAAMALQPAPDARVRWPAAFAQAAVAVALLLGVALTRSRAGVLLAMLALLGTVPLLWRAGVHRRVRRAALVAGAVAAVLLVQFALFAVLQRFARDPLADERLVYAEHTIHAARDYAPVGSGLGTFGHVYPGYEARDPRGMSAARVNHAHDDWLELWLEGGWAALAAMLAFVAWFFATLRAAWRVDGPPELVRHGRALAVAAVLPFLHSWVDYPLRTSAMLAATGLVLGLLVAHAAGGSPRRRGIGNTVG